MEIDFRKRRSVSVRGAGSGMAGVCFALVCFFIFSAFAPVSAQELSFDDALDIMAANNPSIKAANMEKEQRVREREAARGLYFPEITLGAKYSKFDLDAGLDLTGFKQDTYGKLDQISKLPMPMMGFTQENIALAGAVKDFIPLLPDEITIDDDEFRNVDVTLKQPVFTGWRINAANRAADARLRESSEKVRHTRDALFSELVQRYYGLRLYQEIVAVRRRVLGGMESHLFQAKKLEENGVISKAERLHAEVARSEADRLYKKALRDMEIAMTALRNTLAVDSEDGATTIRPTSPLFLNRNIPPAATFHAAALSKNPLLMQVRANRELAHQALRKEKGELYPEVFIFGNKQLYTNDLTLVDPQWAAGICANMTLFDGLSRVNRIRAAKHMESRVAFIEKKAVMDIDTVVDKRYHELMKDIEQYDSINVSLEFAREALRVRTRAFEEGFATSLDVVDARLALEKVEVAGLKAVYDFDVALAELLEAGGISGEFEQYRKSEDVEVTF